MMIVIIGECYTDQKMVFSTKMMKSAMRKLYTFRLLCSFYLRFWVNYSSKVCWDYASVLCEILDCSVKWLPYITAFTDYGTSYTYIYYSQSTN